VTIKGHNFPPNDSFKVRMNWMGTKGVAGTVIETVTTNADGKLSNSTYAIPGFLESAYQVAIRLESSGSGYYAYNWFYNDTTGDDPGKGGIPSSYKGYPTFSISAVKEDKNVTIQTNNLPANDNFVVTMGAMGSKGVGGYWVDKFDSGTGDSQSHKFTIPAQLYGSYQIAIRIESPTTGYYAYNWFYNNTTNGTTPAQPAPGYVGYPTMSISSVDKDDFVTIQGYNFPPNDSFQVSMNWMGSRGISGTVVETVTTDANGKLSDSKYNIPNALKGSYQIAIRLESPTSGYFAYNWFYNNDAP
jgi:5-hydroxyisourate hydrolase-like protein (transthyretin family)